MGYKAGLNEILVRFSSDGTLSCDGTLSWFSSDGTLSCRSFIACLLCAPPLTCWASKGFNPESLFSSIHPTCFVTIRSDIVRTLSSQLCQTILTANWTSPAVGVFQPLGFLLGDGIAGGGGEGTAYKGHLRGPQRTLDRYNWLSWTGTGV